MIKSNEVALDDSEEKTTTVALVFVSFDEGMHSSIKMVSHSNLFISKFEVISLDLEFIKELSETESFPFL